MIPTAGTSSPNNLIEKISNKSHLMLKQEKMSVPSVPAVKATFSLKNFSIALVNNLS